MSPTAQLHQSRSQQATSAPETLHAVDREFVRSLTSSQTGQHAHVRYLMARADADTGFYAARLNRKQHAVLVSLGGEWALSVTGNIANPPHLARDVASLIPQNSMLTAPAHLAQGVTTCWNRMTGRAAKLLAEDIHYVQEKNMLAPVSVQIEPLLVFAHTLPRKQVAKEMSFCWLNVHHHFMQVEQFEQFLETCDAVLWREPGKPLDSFKLFTPLGNTHDKGGDHILLGNSCGLPEHMPHLFAKLAALPARLSAFVSSNNEAQLQLMETAGFRPLRGPSRLATYHLT